MKRNLALGIATVLTCTLTACGAKDADKIGDAQLCLDKATAAEAPACLEKLGDLDSQESHLLRCAGGFIEQGFDQPTKFISAFSQMGSSQNGGGTLALMGILAFDDKTKMDTTFASCEKSGAKGFILLASMAKMATTIGSLFTGTSGDGLAGLQAAISGDPAAAQTAMESAITKLNGSEEEQAEVGATAIVAYQTNCTSGNSTNTQLCSQLSQAVGTNTDPAVVGGNLATILNSQPPQ